MVYGECPTHPSLRLWLTIKVGIRLFLSLWEGWLAGGTILVLFGVSRQLRVKVNLFLHSFVPSILQTLFAFH